LDSIDDREREIAELRLLLNTAEIGQAEAEERAASFEARTEVLEDVIEQARAAKSDLLDEVGELSERMGRSISSKEGLLAENTSLAAEVRASADPPSPPTSPPLSPLSLHHAELIATPAF
jgi:hypothetical protein